MKRVLALTAGVLVALVPTGTAFAGTVPGNAYGNCQHSSSGGEAHTALMPEIGSGLGNGGLVELGKDGGGCFQDATSAPEKGPKGSGGGGKPPVVDPNMPNE